jgi:hypothetical protein
VTELPLDAPPPPEAVARARAYLALRRRALVLRAVGLCACLLATGITLVAALEPLGRGAFAPALPSRVGEAEVGEGRTAERSPSRRNVETLRVLCWYCGGALLLGGGLCLGALFALFWSCRCPLCLRSASPFYYPVRGLRCPRCGGTVRRV